MSMMDENSVPFSYVEKAFENNYKIIKEFTADNRTKNKFIVSFSPYELRARTLCYLLLRKVAIRLGLINFKKKCLL